MWSPATTAPSPVQAQDDHAQYSYNGVTYTYPTDAVPQMPLVNQGNGASATYCGWADCSCRMTGVPCPRQQQQQPTCAAAPAPCSSCEQSARAGGGPALGPCCHDLVQALAQTFEQIDGPPGRLAASVLPQLERAFRSVHHPAGDGRAPAPVPAMLPDGAARIVQQALHRAGSNMLGQAARLHSGSPHLYPQLQLHSASPHSQEQQLHPHQLQPAQQQQYPQQHYSQPMQPPGLSELEMLSLSGRRRR